MIWYTKITEAESLLITEKGVLAMRSNIDQTTQDFIENRDIIKKAIKHESDYIYPVAANVFCAAGVKADADKLKECKRIIKDNAGFASYFKGNVITPLAAKLCITDDPEAAFAKTAEIYTILKEYFKRSEYLAMLAALLAERTTIEEAEKIASRGKALYDMMKKEHPLLTSNEDNIMAGFMAFSTKSDEQLISDAEKCYDLLKKEFSDKNAIQTVSHIFAVIDGTPDEKVERLISMFEMLKKAGHKFGKHFELPSLAAVSIIDADEKELVDNIIGIDTLLEKQKGYGIFSLDKKTRLMHAAMLTADLYEDNTNTEAAISASALAMIAAEEAAMCCAIVAATVAASSANS